MFILSIKLITFQILLYSLLVQNSSYRIVQLSDFFNSDVGYFDDGYGIQGSSPEIEDSLATFLGYVKAEEPDFVLAAGDNVGGRWWGGTTKARQLGITPFGPFQPDNISNYKNFATNAAAVYYPQWWKRFADAGLTVYACPGDHEYGDYPEGWGNTASLVTQLAEYQIELWGKYSSQNTPQVGVQRPVGTPFENTSYSFKHKGTLFLVLDLFDYDYATSTQVAEFGQFYTTVRGSYFDWVEAQLKAGYEDAAITRIFVMGHTPILAYDYANYSSQLVYRDVPGKSGAESKLWALFEKYGVDVYIGGEIHGLNLHTCKGVVQSIANGYAIYTSRLSYVVFDITDNRIDITFKKVPQKPVQVDIWTPSEGEVQVFKVVRQGPQPLKRYTASIIGQKGECKTFKKIPFSKDCLPADQATCNGTKSVAATQVDQTGGTVSDEFPAKATDTAGQPVEAPTEAVAAALGND